MTVRVVGAGSVPTFQDPKKPMGAKNNVYDPTKRGPQTWYDGAHGKPGSDLPRDDLGPVLPGGGWRSDKAGPELWDGPPNKESSAPNSVGGNTDRLPSIASGQRKSARPGTRA